jgi:hypothetical protein
LAQRLAISGVLPILLVLSIVVIPDGSAGIRVSQIWGARRGRLYPGVHLVTPLADSLEMATRDCTDGSLCSWFR